MAKRSPRITEVREKSEISCMWGLFGILESCQGHATPKLISNGRSINKHIIDNPRKLASFDEECRKIKNEADLATKKATVKGQKSTKTDPEHVDHPPKTHKKARKKSQKVNELSSYHLNNAASLIHHPTSASASASASTSAEVVSLNKFKFAAILEAVCAQNHHEEIILSENFRRSIRAKAKMDQMFIERKFLCKEGKSSETQSFSSALEVLNPNKDLCKKIDYQYKYSSETSFTAKKPLDKIVILKPAPRSAIYSENVTCHCSSIQLSGRASDAKIAPFSLREMKKKLKHKFGGTTKGNYKLSQNRSILKVGDECTCHGIDFEHSYTLCKKRGIESNLEPDIASGIGTVRKKLDFSSGRFTKKHEFDVNSEAKRHLSMRLKNVNSVENPTSKKSQKTLGRILSSPERDIWPCSPRRDGQDCSRSAQMRLSPYCLSPLSSIKEVTSCDDNDKYDSTLEILDKETRSSLISNDEGGIETVLSETDNTTCNGELKIAETNSIPRPELYVTSEINSTETTELQKEDENDLFSENETFPSTPSRICHLDMADSNKHQEEHRSPVSVLEPFFIEDSNSPSSITPRTGPFSSGQPLQPLRLDFEERSFESSTPGQPIQTNTCIEDQDYISHYVHLVLQEASLNWDNLSETKPLPEELLHESLFDDLIDFQPADCYFDPKLLFDHMNEVLQEIYQSHFCLPPWLSSFITSRIRSVPLEEVVLDEIMNEAEFYLLPRTEKRTLDQLVSKDIADCGSWIDVRHDTEQIVIDISEDLLEGSILDVLLEFHI